MFGCPPNCPLTIENPLASREKLAAQNVLFAKQEEEGKAQEEAKAAKLELRKAERAAVYEAVATETSHAVTSLIPAPEWGMPMTLWVVQGGIAAKTLAGMYADSRKLLGCEVEAASVWDFAKPPKSLAEGIEKLGDIVILEQQGNAKEVAKAALLAGKFVVWIARGSVAQYAKANARGVAVVPCYAKRARIWLEKMRERGWGWQTEGGRHFEECWSELSGEREWPVAIEAAVCGLVNKVLEVCLEGEENAALLLPKKSLDMIERCFGFESKDYPEAREGDPTKLSETVALAQDTRHALEKLCKKIRSRGKGAGVLLHGLPGTGKTMLAKVLAIESGRAWIEASYASWQACDHLGEHLAAMAASFEEAIEKAPSVMFIDELDSIGSREGAKRNSSYMTPVINAMLEWVQEAIARDVVIIGASNHPEMIDQALVRPGRIGEWIEVAYPGKAQRAELIAKELPKAGDAMEWAARIGRASPAKIMEMVHLAREIAQERDALEPLARDVEAALAGEVARNLGGRSMQALALPMAVGLCAKAWMMGMAKPPSAGEARVLRASIAPGIEDLGRLEIEGGWGSGSAELAWARLQVALAPAAARAALAKASHGGLGLSVMADVDQEDRAAAAGCLRELSRAGMAMANPRRVGSNWLGGDAGVDELANAAWDSALAGMGVGLAAIQSAASVLAREGSLSGERLMAELGFEARPGSGSGGLLH